LIGVNATLPCGVKLFEENALGERVFVLYTGQVKLSMYIERGPDAASYA
jgi:hypothetical protein